MSLRISILLILGILSISCSKFNKAQKSENVEFKYATAEEFYKKGDYYRAGVLFEELIPLLRGSKQAEDAMFYYAYTQFYQGQLSLSAYHFRKFFDLYPRTDRAEEALFMHCKSLYLDSPDYSLDQTNTSEAIESIQLFVNRFSSSKYIDECNQMIDKCRRKLETKAFENAKLYFKLGDFKASVVAFKSFSRDFPDSPKVEEATYYKVLSQYNLAKISVEYRKLERYKASVEMYQEFVDKFPESKFVRSLEYTYTNSNNQIIKLSQNN
ncbi:MAG: outer membrane protein assembly factor BamD [Cytophagales bacterium]